MRSLDFRHYALISCVTAAMLAGCGSQPPIGAPGTMPQAAGRGIGQNNRRASSSYKVLYSFGNRPDGANPEGGLIDNNGTLYGTTADGGRYGKGTVFSISTSGAEQVLYSFRGSDGERPRASLINIGGTLYGTTADGGAYHAGTVFSISTSGAEQVLHSFGGRASHDGRDPKASLLDVNGTLYGTTFEGGTGTNCAPSPGCGTVFKISTNGANRVLHSFGGSPDGASPWADLIYVKGMFFGTTYVGGLSPPGGTVFSITTSGTEAILHTFSGSGYGGADPSAGLIDVRGTLYGTTQYGGTSDNANGGTVFSITTSGKVHVLHIFGYPPDGAYPIADLIAVKGTLYGTTFGGGTYCRGGSCGYGTVFSITTSGAEQTLHVFNGGNDGANPRASLIDVKGTLYGTTQRGGTDNKGTVFALTP